VDRERERGGILDRAQGEVRIERGKRKERREPLICIFTSIYPYLSNDDDNHSKKDN
jgi:hypothetical protein